MQTSLLFSSIKKNKMGMKEEKTRKILPGIKNLIKENGKTIAKKRREMK